MVFAELLLEWLVNVTKLLFVPLPGVFFTSFISKKGNFVALTILQRAALDFMKKMYELI